MMLSGIKRNMTRLQKLLDIHSISSEYDKIYLEHQGASFYVQYMKRDFKNYIAKRTESSNLGQENRTKECLEDLATIVENEAIQRTLLSYDVCHPPIYGQGKNLLTGKSVTPKTPKNLSSQRHSFKPRLMLLPKKPIEKAATYPQVAFGIGSVTASLTDDEIVSLLHGALKLGIRHFDMAKCTGTKSSWKTFRCHLAVGKYQSKCR